MALPFLMTAEDRRKIQKYAEDEKLIYRGKQPYTAFIAKSFEENQTAMFFLSN